jgi:hypothetical protein
MIHSDEAICVGHAALGIAGRVSAQTASSARPDTPLPEQIGGSADPESTAGRATCAPARQPGLRSWPLLVLAAPAVVAVWSGWVGIGQMTGFAEVRPLPGIWDSLHIDSAVTLPVGVEAYAAFALRAWLTSSPVVSDRTRRFARWSAIIALVLGMAGRLPPAHPGGTDQRALGGHHAGVLPAGPGPRHRVRARAPAAQRRVSSREAQSRHLGADVRQAGR